MHHKSERRGEAMGIAKKITEELNCTKPYYILSVVSVSVKFVLIFLIMFGFLAQTRWDPSGILGNAICTTNDFLKFYPGRTVFIFLVCVSK